MDSLFKKQFQEHYTMTTCNDHLQWMLSSTVDLACFHHLFGTVILSDSCSLIRMEHLVWLFFTLNKFIARNQFVIFKHRSS